MTDSLRRDQRSRAASGDLLAVVGLVVAGAGVFLGPLSEVAPLRILVGLPLLLLAPGYALVAALFPGAQTDSGSSRTGWSGTGAGETGTADSGTLGRLRSNGIDGSERSVLSVGLSVAIVPLVAVLLDATVWGVHLIPVVTVVSALTLAGAGVAVVRRLRLAPTDRYSVGLGNPTARLAAPELSGRADSALNVLVVASVLFAACGAAYAVATPPEGDTGFALLTEDESGSLTAEEYPTSFERGERKPVVLGVENVENEPVNYTVVVELQRATESDGAPLVVAETELDRFSARVADGETWRTNYDVEPTFTGDRLRLAFLLYRGDVPDNPGVESAYRTVQLWVSVSEPGE